MPKANTAKASLLDEQSGYAPAAATPGQPPTSDTAVADALAVRDEAERAVSMFERLAKDPAVDVEKLERLIAMQERIMRHQAKAAFDAAFAQMQPAIPEIDEQGKIIVKGIQRSTYAKLEDIHKVIKPILAQYGFAIRHRTEWPPEKPNIIRIVGILSHEQGHSEESSFEAPMDKSDFRSDIQSQGSTVSYGRRYTTLDLLNIATRGQDKDGQKPEATKTPDPPPAGYDDWVTDLSAVADEGWPKLSDAFNKSKQEYKRYLTTHDRLRSESLKQKAQAVTKAQREAGRA